MAISKQLGLAPNDVIRYTEEDINEAVSGDQYDCAISCAIARRYPSARRIMTNDTFIAFSIGEDRFVYKTDEDTVENVLKPFDAGEAIEPGIVHLRNGYIKPVKHVDPDRQVAEARRREREIKRRGTPNFPVRTGTSRDSGRFSKGSNDG